VPLLVKLPVMLILPPVEFEIPAPPLMIRLLKFLALAPPIEFAAPVNVNVDVPPAIVPAVAVKSLATVFDDEPKLVVAPELLSTRLKNVGVPTTVCVPLEPLKVTVPLPDNVPLLVQVLATA